MRRSKLDKPPFDVFVGFSKLVVTDNNRLLARKIAPEGKKDVKSVDSTEG